MQAKIIELKQAPVVLVGLPYLPMQIWAAMDRTKIHYRNEAFGDWIAIKNIPKFDSVLGILSNLTEEQFAECVVSPFPPIRSDKTEFYRTRKESFYSLLESEGVYTENFLGGEPDPLDDYYRDANGITDEFYKSLKEWQEAQSRTIDPERTVVLLKNKS